MLLAIDAGNTNTVFALCEDDKICQSWRCKTDPARTADEYASWLLPLCTQSNVEFSQVSAIIISSVVPEINFNLERLCRKYFSGDPVFVRYGEVDLGMDVLLDRPSEAGADRLVNAVAVNTYYSSPAIIIDFGTSTNFDVIDGQGRYCGGALAPGVNLSLNALHRAAAKLPKVSIMRPPDAIGQNTVHAMQSGLYWGYVSMIKGLIEKLQESLGQDAFVIATGGLASVFRADIPAIQEIDDDLTLKGLLQIYKRTEQK